MVPIHNYSTSPDSLLVNGVVPQRIRHHHEHKTQLLKNITDKTEDTCYCVPFK